jgi:PAS domain S-box-containing protein
MPGPYGPHLEEWFEAAQAGLALVDARGDVLGENAQLVRLAGRTAAELVADPAVAGIVAEAAAGAMPDGVMLPCAGSPVRRVSVSALPLRQAVALTVLPVDDHRIVEETLRLSLEGTNTGSWVWDVVADEISWSPNLGPLHGLDRGASPNAYATWLGGLHPDDRERVRATIDGALDRGEDYKLEFRVGHADGRVRWLDARAHVMLGASGEPQVVVGLTTDVTERKRREQAAQILANAGLALAESVDDEATLQQIADLAVPVLADWCAVHVVDQEGRPTRIAVAHGDPDRLAWARTLSNRSRTTTRGPAVVVRTGQPELWPVIDEAFLRETAVDDAHLELLRKLGMRSAMIVPVTARGRTLGAITFLHAESGRQHDETDLRLGEELGRRAGLAMENAALHRSQRDANRRLRDLQSVTDVALTHLELDALLRELLARVGEVLESDIVKVLLYDEDRTVLRVRAAQGLPEDAVRQLRIPPGAGAAGRIAAAGRPLIIADLGEADVVLRDLRQPGRALAGVPLQAHGETFGVLIVSSLARPYDQADLQLLALVADRAARAIRQAELYEAARDAALQLQRSLLPEALPAVDGIDMSAQYLPGQDGTVVGGDWYDLFQLPDGRLAIVVGDVVGRGLRAAARMGRVRTALRAYAFESSSPAEAVERMDRLVAAEETIEFTTLLAVFLDPRSGAAVACSAGHLPPLLVDADGATIAAVANGPPLGVAAARRQETLLQLPEGTMLVAYTDGLVEDRATGIDVGLRQLLGVAALGGSARVLVDRVVDRLTAERQADDDVAIVAVGRVGAGIAHSFPAEPAAVAAARHEITSFAAAHGVSETILRDVALAVSEACTNVVVHAYRDTDPGVMHISARRDDDGLEVSVVDEGGGVRPRADSPGVGLGLQIIARTTQRFDVRDAPGGGAELVLRFEA